MAPRVPRSLPSSPPPPRLQLLCLAVVLTLTATLPQRSAALRSRCLYVDMPGVERCGVMPFSAPTLNPADVAQLPVVEIQVGVTCDIGELELNGRAYLTLTNPESPAQAMSTSSTIRLGAGLAGTVVLSISLVVDGDVVDTLHLCFTFTPGPWEHRINTVPALTQAQEPLPTGDPYSVDPSDVTSPALTLQRRLWQVDHSIHTAPLRVLWIGDRKGFDGMKRAVLDKFLHVPREAVEPTFADFRSCDDSPSGARSQGRDSVFGRLIDASYTPQFEYCIQCSTTLCPDPAAFVEEVRLLATAETLDDVTPWFRPVVEGVVRFFSRFNAVVLVWWLAVPRWVSVWPRSCARPCV